MKGPSPIISDLPLVGPGTEDAWPEGAVREAQVFERPAIGVWNAKVDGAAACVTALKKDAPEGAASDFVDAVRRLAAAAAEPGLLAVKKVDPNGRWVLHEPVVGALADLPSIGWKLARKLELMTALCDIVARGHARGVAHGALTPLSVALDEGMKPVLVSPSGPSIWGDPDGLEYLVPELLLGAPPTERSDVYALGRLLAFLLLGSHPPAEKEAVPRLDALSKVPAGLSRIVRRATLGNPDLRYGSVAELLKDVRNYGDFEKVGLALDTAVELNKTGMSKPPAPLARAREPAAKTAPAPHGGNFAPPPVPASKRRLLRALALVLVAAVAWTFGAPLVQVAAEWRSRRALATGSPAEKGQALVHLAARGERDLGNLPLAGADLSRAPLTGVSLVGADLSSAKLDGADLAEASLAGANLTGASAFGTNLATANVEGVRGMETVTCDRDTSAPQGWSCADGHLAPRAPRP